MTSKDRRQPSSPPSKGDRLAQALRDNLARRKALVRAKRARAAAADDADPATAPGTERPDGDT
jgi:hypothetical protein